MLIRRPSGAESCLLRIRGSARSGRASPPANFRRASGTQHSALLSALSRADLSPGLPQLLGRVLPNRLEHPVARRRPRSSAPRATCRRAARAGRARPHVLEAVARADRLGRLERPPAGEDREPAQERPLLLGEQVVAPVDRRPQRLLARRARAAPARQQRGSGRRASRGSARPRAPSRARPRARSRAGCRRAGGRSARPRGVLVGRARSPGCAASRARRRAARPRTRRAPPASARASGSGTESAGTRQTASPGDAERLAARREDPQVRARAQELLDERGAGVDEVLAVVEHEQRRARPRAPR